MISDKEKLDIVLTARDMASQTIKRTTASVEASMARLSGKILSLQTVIAAAAGMYGVLRLVSNFEKLAAVQEKAEAGMTQAMRSMGRYTPELHGQLLRVASGLQDMSTFGDEAVISGQKFLLTYAGIADDLLPRASAAMVDIAALMGGDMRQAANMLGKASMGMTGELRRAGITVDETAYKSQGFVGVLKEIENQVKGQALALRSTKSGGLEAYKNVVGDVQEKFGQFTLSIRSNIAEGLLPAMKSLDKTLGENQSQFNQWATSISDAITKIVAPQLQRLPHYFDVAASAAKTFFGIWFRRPEGFQAFVELTEKLKGQVPEGPSFRGPMPMRPKPGIQFDRGEFTALQERLHAEAAYWEFIEKVRQSATQKGLTLIQEAMEAETQAIQAGLDEQTAAIQAGVDDIAAIRAAGFAKGLTLLDQAMAEETHYIEEGMSKAAEYANSMSDDIKNAVTGWASSFSQTLTDLVWGAEQSFARIAESFARMLTQMVMQKTIVEPMLTGIWKMFGWAKGAVFRYGNPIAFGLGGIISRPTIFPMANGGIGLAGEAGEEAILPLTRLPSGDLGVKAQGGTSPVNFKLEVHNNTGNQAKVRQERPTWNGQEWVVSLWLDAYQRNVSGMRDIIGV